MSNTKANNNRKWWVLAGATLLYLATVADGPNFNAALSTIQDYFQASAGRGFFNLGSKAGLTSEQIQKAVEVLRSAFATGVAMTMFLLAGVLYVSALVI